MQRLEVGGNAKYACQNQDRSNHLGALPDGWRGRWGGGSPVSSLVVVGHINPSIGDGDNSFVRDKAQDHG